MAATEDVQQKQAEIFLQKIASKLPVQSTSESTIIGLFEGIVESLEKNVIKATILASLDYFYGIFEIAVKKQLETQVENSLISSTARKIGKSGLKEIANAHFPILTARILLGTIDENIVHYSSSGTESTIEKSRDQTILNILIAVQYNKLSASQMAAILLNTMNVAGPSRSSEQLSKAFLTRLSSNSEWCVDEAESSGCLWAYSTLMSNTSKIRKIGIKSLFVLCGSNSDFWLYAFGFLGLWGVKKIENENEILKIKNVNDIKEEEKEIVNMISDFLENPSMNISDNIEFSDVILCLTLLFIYINKLGKTDLTERTLNCISVQLLAISYKSRGNVQLFWTDAILPIIVNRIGVGKTIKNKVKSFSNNTINPLRPMLDWIGGTPGLVDVLCEAVRELIGDSTGGDEVGDTDDVDEDNNNIDDNIDNHKITDLKEKPFTLSVSDNKKRKSEVPMDTLTSQRKESGQAQIELKRGGDEEEEAAAEEEEEEILMGSYELDVKGDAKNVLSFMEEESEKKNEKVVQMPSRKSTRNENKKNEAVTGLDEKSEMELELQILEQEEKKKPKVKKPKLDESSIKKVKKTVK